MNNFNDFGEIVSFEIQHEGKLNKLNSVSSEGVNPCHLNICPSKKVLFTVNYGAPNKEIGQKEKISSIASHKIQKNGQLSRSISRYAHFGESTHPKRQKSHTLILLFHTPMIPMFTPLISEPMLFLFINMIEIQLI